MALLSVRAEIVFSCISTLYIGRNSGTKRESVQRLRRIEPHLHMGFQGIPSATEAGFQYKIPGMVGSDSADAVLGMGSAPESPTLLPFAVGHSRCLPQAAESEQLGVGFGRGERRGLTKYRCTAGRTPAPKEMGRRGCTPTLLRSLGSRNVSRGDAESGLTWPTLPVCRQRRLSGTLLSRRGSMALLGLAAALQHNEGYKSPHTMHSSLSQKRKGRRCSALLLPEDIVGRYRLPTSETPRPKS